MGLLDFFISTHNGQVVDTSNWTPGEILAGLESDDYMTPGAEDKAAVEERGNEIVFGEYDTSSNWFKWW